MVTYKILVNSIPFANMRGTSPAEVAKKAASKILGNSLNYVCFSIQAKTEKIRHYDAKRENLVRPYYKNGKLVKYRIVVKKLGKQVGGTFPPDLSDDSDPIFTFFPRARGEYFIKIQNSSVYIYNKDNLCIKFAIEDRELGIFELHHCGYKGSTNLRKIIGYAKKLNENSKIIDSIGLLDGSYFKEYEDISLTILYILSTGISWYNYFGFISDNYDEEKNYNQQFLSMNFETFLDECIKKIIEKKLKYYEELNKENLETVKNEKDAVIERIRLELNEQQKKLIKKFSNLNIQELFTRIKKKLIESRLEESELEAILELFKFIKNSGIIMYNLILKLEL